MHISEAKASLRHLRPLIGYLPWMLFGTLVTMAFGVGLVCFRWLSGVSQSGIPKFILVLLVVAGFAMLLFLVPAQIRAMLREIVGQYSIDADESALTISYKYCGLSGSKTVPWKDIVFIGFSSGGLPPCDFIRIKSSDGFSFAFGAFFDASTREEILRSIEAADTAIHTHKTASAAQ